MERYINHIWIIGLISSAEEYCLQNYDLNDVTVISICGKKWLHKEKTKQKKRKLLICINAYVMVIFH